MVEKRGEKMKKKKIKQKIEEIRIVGVTIGIFLMVLGTFMWMKIDLRYTIIPLVIAGIVGLILILYLEAKLK